MPKQRPPDYICSIEDCGRAGFARGWCRMHYMRWRKHGDPTLGGYSSRRRAAREDGRSNHPLYGIWSHMIYRCHNPNYRVFRDYGGRGITVCDRWRADFWAFVEDMDPRPGPEYSLDRIDNMANYEKANCRWATREEQARNRRPRSHRDNHCVGCSCFMGDPISLASLQTEIRQLKAELAIARDPLPGCRCPYVIVGTGLTTKDGVTCELDKGHSGDHYSSI